MRRGLRVDRKHAPSRIRVVVDLRGRDDLVHRPVDVDLGQAELRGIQVEQTQHLERRPAHGRRSRRRAEERHVAGLNVKARGLERVRLGRELPRNRRGLHRQVRWCAGRRGRHQVQWQIEIEDDAESALQVRMGLERAEGLVEVERFRIDGHLSGLLLGRRRHVVVGAERTGDALEGRGVPRRSDQALRVQRPVERACRTGGKAAVAGDGAPALGVVTVPVNVEAVQHGAQALPVGDRRASRVAFFRFVGIGFVGWIGQRQHDAGFLIDRFEGAQRLAHRERHDAVRRVVVELARPHESAGAEQRSPQIGLERARLDRDRGRPGAACKHEVGAGLDLLRPVDPVRKGVETVGSDKSRRDQHGHRQRRAVHAEPARDHREENGMCARHDL